MGGSLLDRIFKVTEGVEKLEKRGIREAALHICGVLNSSFRDGVEQRALLTKKEEEGIRTALSAILRLTDI
jgi:hypothetical protein